MRHGYITTIHPANKKQSSGKSQAKRHQSDHESHDQLARLSSSSSRIVKVFFSSTFYHVVLQLIVHITHHSFTGYVLLFGRKVMRNLCVVCCFLTTTHLSTSPTSHRLLFSTQVSPNFTLKHILQILNPTITIYSQI